MKRFNESKQATGRWVQRLPYMLFLTGVIFLASNPFSLLDFPLDDAWIHRVYSQSFAFGNGFEYNPGQQEAGSTSPLWSILTAPVHWFQFLGNDFIVILVKLTGILLCLASIRATFLIGNRLSLERIAWIGAVVLALDPRMPFSALSGMEGPLVVALWLWSAYALLTKRPWTACALVSLTPTARPECLAVLPFFTLAFALTAVLERWRLKHWFALMLLPVPMLLWSLFCLHANGRWLPTTFYMKAGSFSLAFELIRMTWDSIQFRGIFPAAVVIILLLPTVANLAVRQRGEFGTILLLLAIAPGAYIFGVVCGRSFLFDGYYWTRWVESPALILTACAGIGLALFLSNMKHLLPFSRTQCIARITAILIIITALPFMALSFKEQRHHMVNDSRNIHMINVRAGKWLYENTDTVVVVAINDAGAIRYFSQRKCIDLIGLNNADIAFSRGIDDAVRKSDWVVIFPVWFNGATFFEHLKIIQTFSVPPDEYTICRNKGQSVMVVYRNTLNNL